MTASSLASVEVPRPGTYRIDPQRSTVSYSGRHMFGLGVVHATFAISSGELRVADPSTASTVTVSVDAGSFHSNSAKRDKAVRSATFLDTAAYPEITFASDGLREDGDHWRLTGNVTAHGNTAPVNVLIDQATHEAGAWRVHARAEHLTAMPSASPRAGVWSGVTSTWTSMCSRYRRDDAAGSGRNRR